MSNLNDTLLGSAQQLGTGGAGHAFASARSSGAVTASDSTALDFNALWIGVAGNVTIKHTASGDAVTYSNVPVGILPVAGVRVMAATTATGVVWMKW